jgi:hypothetical protein
LKSKCYPGLNRICIDAHPVREDLFWGPRVAKHLRS